MASEHVCKVLFILQSVAFIGLVMYYYESFGSISTRSETVYMVPRVHPNVCEEAVTRPFDFGSIWKDSSTRGSVSNCTKTDIMKRPNVVLLTTTNQDFLDVTMNMLESIKKVGLCVYTVIVAEDKTVYWYLRKRTDGDPGIHVEMTNSGESSRNDALRKSSKLYFGFLKKRQHYVLALLKQGYEVLFSDADTFWFQDPFPYFEGDFDISMMDPRSPYPTRTSRAHYCTGFGYYKPTNVTLLFVEAWIESLKKKTIMDQVMMNNLLRADKPVHVNIKPLHVKIFPYGPKFYKYLAEDANYSAVVMHAASLRGHSKKVEKFKSSNMWLVNATSAELIASQQR